jgi:protein SCO1/2
MAQAFSLPHLSQSSWPAPQKSSAPIIIEPGVLALPRKLIFSLAIVLSLSGCQQGTPSAPLSANSASSTAAPKDYPVRGRIVSVTGSSVMLDHEAVAGLMGAMTMSYKLKDPSIAGELHPGDHITADLLVTVNADGLDDILLDKIVVISQARPDYKPAVQYHVPQPGDAVPDFKLLNQDNRTIHLSQFHGRVLLITFIYTRCPLADFCPRMSRNFAGIDKSLAADPTLYSKTHLLSISFDPAYDTPTVLRSYAEGYARPITPKTLTETFKHWDFAAPSPQDLPALTQFFNVGVTPGDSQSLNHSLSTILIGKDGKIAAWYPTNDWNPSDIIAKIKQAAIA